MFYFSPYQLLLCHEVFTLWIETPYKSHRVNLWSLCEISGKICQANIYSLAMYWAAFCRSVWQICCKFAWGKYLTLLWNTRWRVLLLKWQDFTPDNFLEVSKCDFDVPNVTHNQMDNISSFLYTSTFHEAVWCAIVHVGHTESFFYHETL